MARPRQSRPRDDASARPSAPAAAGGDPKSAIQTYRKMLAVLECFSTVDRRLSLAEITARVGLPRATTHRILAALKQIGFIEQDERSSAYGLGLRLFQLGSRSLANMDLHREAKPFVDRLRDLTGESVHLGVFDGMEMVVIERGRGDERWRLGTELETAPAYCTGVGKAALAFQDERAVRQLIAGGLRPFTANTITDGASLLAELKRIQRQGFAVDDAEHQPAIACVAAPIRDRDGRVFAAISVSGPNDRVTAKRIPALAELVKGTADAISRQLGWRGPAAAT
ncbi:MAG: IclR family transcriptional regulator [Alphaproteobacteria bacterium]|nr:IclR family transcriptional regulator [Alphaproteobacteria bacterium]